MILLQAEPTAASGYSSLIFLALLVAMFYFLLIRPQRTRAKKQAEMAASLQMGDRVQTFGGVYGIVESMDEDSVVLRLEDGKMRVSRRAIGSKTSEQD
ncbi:MAG TPA: preprotein translocase subunit YajC [Acidimicrobiia bacterium]|nr:preprotein translocase subunit YajC [Acidimicrobiia bacterium]